MSKLEASIAALRADGDGAAQVPHAASTRSRVQKSLARRAKSRRRIVQASLVVSVLLVSTFSWAWSTGRISFRASPEPVIAPQPEPVVPAPVPAPRAPSRVVPEAVVVPEVVVPPPPVVVEKPKAIAITPTEQLYRTAHELHFKGGDPATALAAWDAYLVAESSGRFAIEARYNRGLLLARLGRYAEARAALAPYSAGEINGGYRRTEARAIIDRLDQIAPVNEAPINDAGVGN